MANKFVNYDLKQCCPDLSAECAEVVPFLSFSIQRPSNTNNNNGIISITVTGLNRTYNYRWLDNGDNGVFQTGLQRQNLIPGDYTLVLSDTFNRQCTWNYNFHVPAYDTFNVEVYYQGEYNFPIPSAVGVGVDFSDLGPNAEARFMDDAHVLDRGTTGGEICLEVLVQGGIEPLNIKWDDYTSYGVLPASLDTTGLQTDTISPDQETKRPPKIISSDTTKPICCFDLAVQEGNGWVKVTVTDSNFPSDTRIFWIYLRQTVL